MSSSSPTASIDAKIKKMALSPNSPQDTGDRRVRRNATFRKPQDDVEASKRKTLNLTGISGLFNGVRETFTLNKTPRGDKSKSKTSSEESDGPTITAEDFMQKSSMISEPTPAPAEPVRVVSRSKAFKDRVKQRKAFTVSTAYSDPPQTLDGYSSD